MKRAVIWVPDWPVESVLIAGKAEPQEAIAVVDGRGVVACNSVARELGVQRGMRKRNAQLTVPELRVFPRDESYELQVFDRVARVVHQHVAELSIVKPGTLTFGARGPIRSAGSPHELAEILIGDIAGETGVEAHIGFGNGLLCATLAARQDLVIEDAQAFLDSQPIDSLRYGCLTHEDDQRMSACIHNLHALGIQRVGDLRGLEKAAVISRFGSVGASIYRLLAGDEGYIGRQYSEETVVHRRSFDDPLNNIDQAAFVARHIAQDVVDELTYRGVISRELSIDVRMANGQSRNRVWAMDVASARDITDRVRWQLAAWINEHSGEELAGVVELSVTASELYSAGHAQTPLWGGRQQHEQAAQRAISRIQSLLGEDAVSAPEHIGGRLPHEAYVARPWNAECSKSVADAPWPGAIPQPWPSVVAQEPLAVRLLDKGGHECLLSTLGTFYCDERCADSRPHRLVTKQSMMLIDSYAGPWLYSLGWWNPQTQERSAWIEARDQNGHGFLISRENGQWGIRGEYA